MTISARKEKKAGKGVESTGERCYFRIWWGSLTEQVTFEEGPTTADGAFQAAAQRSMLQTYFFITQVMTYFITEVMTGSKDLWEEQGVRGRRKRVGHDCNRDSFFGYVVFKTHLHPSGKVQQGIGYTDMNLVFSENSSDYKYKFLSSEIQHPTSSYSST